MDVETFRWLLTAQGQELLRHAADAYTDAHGDEVRAAAAVRRTEADHERAAAALTQVRLRIRARAKFGADAAAMYFTPDALEQATRARVAEHRAARLAAADPGSVVDLGCGIGGDLLAFARAGLTAAGVDRDPVRVAITEANLAALAVGGAALVAEATSVDTRRFGAAYADPSRRTERGRTFRPADWDPPWEFITGLFAGLAVVKVAPGIGDEFIPDQAEAEWVSDHGELKEAVLWSPALSTATYRATVLGDGGLATLTDEDDPYQGKDRPVRELGEYLYEPDPAVIRSGLVTAVAAGVDGGLLDPHIAYVTSDRSFRTPFARAYRVLERLPYREKQLRIALRQRNIGPLTIKKRGVDVVPELLRQRLGLTGDRPATLVLTRAAGSGVALLVRPF